MAKKSEFQLAQRTALIALMAAARDLSNNELKELTGTSLTGKPREQLNEMRLIKTNTKATPHVHSLTDDGWAWCTKELSAGAPAGSSSALKTLYTLLAGIDRYLSRSNLRLADVFSSTANEPISVSAPTDVESRVRGAYKKLRKEPRGWVSLTDLRGLLPDLSKDEVDAALYRMNRVKGTNIIPQSNQKVLTSEDRKAMVRIGNEDKLLLSIDEP